MIYYKNDLSIKIDELEDTVQHNERRAQRVKIALLRNVNGATADCKSTEDGVISLDVYGGGINADIDGKRVLDNITDCAVIYTAKGTHKLKFGGSASAVKITFAGAQASLKVN